MTNRYRKDRQNPHRSGVRVRPVPAVEEEPGRLARHRAPLSAIDPLPVEEERGRPLRRRAPLAAVDRPAEEEERGRPLRRRAPLAAVGRPVLEEERGRDRRRRRGVARERLDYSVQEVVILEGKFSPALLETAIEGEQTINTIPTASPDDNIGPIPSGTIFHLLGIAYNYVDDYLILGAEPNVGSMFELHFYNLDGTVAMPPINIGSLGVGDINGVAFREVRGQQVIWVADSVNDHIVAVSPEGVHLPLFSLSDTFLTELGIAQATGLTTDGATLWILDSSDDHLYAVTVPDEDGVSLRQTEKEIDVGDVVSANDARGVTTDGTTIWVVDSVDDHVYAFGLDMGGARVSGREILSGVVTGAGISFPSGLTVSGDLFWITDSLDTTAYAFSTTTTGTGVANVISASHATDLNTESIHATTIVAGRHGRRIRVNSIEVTRSQADVFALGLDYLDFTDRGGTLHSSQFQGYDVDLSVFPFIFNFFFGRRSPVGYFGEAVEGSVEHFLTLTVPADEPDVLWRPSGDRESPVGGLGQSLTASWPVTIDDAGFKLAFPGIDRSANLDQYLYALHDMLWLVTVNYEYVY